MIPRKSRNVPESVRERKWYPFLYQGWDLALAKQILQGALVGCFFLFLSGVSGGSEWRKQCDGLKLQIT